jgi:hypothetical protein
MSEFWSTLFKVPGKGGWTFAPIPDEHAPPITGPWGRVPVVATFDGRRFEGSAWKDTKRGWLLAIPAKVRGGRGEGDTAWITLEVDPDRL